MNVELPDGSTLEGVPDNATKVDILGKLQRANHPAAPIMMKQMAAKQTADETSAGGRHLAGIGLAFRNAERAGRQMMGMGAPDFAENRETDRALNSTPAGFAGNMIGNIAMSAPLAAMPGANTVLGAGLGGAAVGAAQPTDTQGERVTNMGVGGLLGAGTQALAGPIAQKVGEWGGRRQAGAASRQSRNAERDETIRRGQEAGLVTPPSAINEPSFLGKRLESLAGKAALSQEASLRNQQPVNALSRSAAGLAEDQPINVQNLRTARQTSSAPYREISALSPQAARDLEAAQAARAESKLQWKHYGRSADPAAHRAATAADQQMESALDRIDQAAQAAGRPELIDSLKQARSQIARNHQVQGALNRGTGDVDPAVIGRALDNGAPLTGELETIGRYQQAFPHSMREASKVPAPGVGKTELLASALLSGGGYQASDSPYGALAGLAPFASGPARSALLSKSVQRMLAKPNYSPGLTANSAAALENPETRRRAAMLARAMALPAIPQAVNQ